MEKASLRKRFFVDINKEVIYEQKILLMHCKNFFNDCVNPHETDYQFNQPPNFTSEPPTFIACVVVTSLHFEFSGPFFNLFAKF